MDAPTLTDDNVSGDSGELGGLNDILGLRIRLAHGAVYRHFAETLRIEREDARSLLEMLGERVVRA